LADRGAALVIEEKDLEKEFETVFIQLLDSNKQQQMAENLKKLAQPQATSKIVNLVEALL
jgi:UDP-N-acetylglucosamine--N-acetylmuramyl-(pentapeptide) pyrophosphoryl-undecaprenol N-acetylglucosamine transferase